MSIIERKLSNDVKRDWAKLVSSEHSPVDKKDKFPSLRLRFLQKQAIEYENAELRSNSNVPVTDSLHYLEKRNDKVTILERQDTSRYKRNKCLYHEGANHWTNECRLYLSKPVQERRDTLKEKGACWSCLKRGHRTQDCRGKKPCGTGIAEVTGSNPVEALIFFFFRLLLSNCLNWKIYCDDHSSLSNHVALTTAKGFTTKHYMKKNRTKSRQLILFSQAVLRVYVITKLKRAYSKYRRYLQRMDSQTSCRTRERHCVL